MSCLLLYCGDTTEKSKISDVFHAGYDVVYYVSPSDRELDRMLRYIDLMDMKDGSSGHTSSPLSIYTLPGIDVNREEVRLKYRTLVIHAPQQDDLYALFKSIKQRCVISTIITLIDSAHASSEFNELHNVADIVFDQQETFKINI